MKRHLSSLPTQLIGLVFIGLLTAAYCLSFGNCSLLTPDQQAYRYYARGDYAQAAQVFRQPMWRGVALYKQGEFKAAAAVFAGYDTAEAAFNHGNALVLLGKYTEAVERYDRALVHRPGWQDATSNRDLALARAKLVEKKGGEMTGGKLKADDIVFSKGKSPESAGEEQVTAALQPDDAGFREVWLRQVQTKPADFLRAKFAYQQAKRETQSDSQGQLK